MIKEKRKILESDLFQPVHDFFKDLGYEVHGEVNGCDVTASKKDELIVIELKRSLNIDLLIQAAKRQRLTEYVYMAIPRSSCKMYTRRWKDICFLVRRLELGLITVLFNGDTTKVDIIINPSPFDKKKSMQVTKRKTKKLISEIEGRHGNYNLGGSTGKKIMTSYKECSIQIACYLKKYGQLSPKKLREFGTGKKTLSILYKNYYGWFERVDKGIYAISDKGLEDLKEFPGLVAFYSSEKSSVVK